MTKEKFISEPIEPITSAMDISGMAIGEPGLPLEFIWRGKTVRIVEIRRRWKDTGPCRHGSGERYVRKHWYEVATASDGIMKIYFERQPKGGRKFARWWLFTINRE